MAFSTHWDNRPYGIFFEAPEGEFECLAASAQAGSAWTLLYPGFSVVPLPRPIAVPLVYPIAGPREEPLRGFVGHWISLRKRDGTIDALYEYWILGKKPGPRAPRWCILRDVVGWID